VWRYRLLKSGERGSVLVESIFAIVFLMVLAMGVAQLALTLYGRNVVIASAHEGARAGTELGRTVSEAEAIARKTTRSATGSLVDDLNVEVLSEPVGGDTRITVRLSGTLTAIGPVPISVPIDTRATSVRPGDVE
jgi:microcystin degradation protein MlrC